MKMLNHGDEIFTELANCAERYQEFFDFMANEHRIILTISEMDEIIHEAQKFLNKAK